MPSAPSTPPIPALNAFGRSIYNNVGLGERSILWQLSYIFRLMFWPTLFTTTWIILCTIPGQIREYYLVVIQNYKQPGGLLPLFSLLTCSYMVASACYFVAIVLCCMRGQKHKAFNARLLVAAAYIGPTTIFSACFAAVPLGIFLSPYREALEPSDYSTFWSFIICYTLLGLVTVGLLVASPFYFKRSWLSGVRAICGGRSYRTIALLAILSLCLIVVYAAGYLSMIRTFGAGKFAQVYDFELLPGLATALVFFLIVFALVDYFLRSVSGFPLAASLLGLAFIFAALDLNDNHRFRQNNQPRKWDLLPLHQAFRAWLCARKDLPVYTNRPLVCGPTTEGSSPPRGQSQPYPVYLVAAQGGGIYAAHQAAMFLSKVEDRCPGFSQHVFAISSVSGGSLGAATFSAITSKMEQRDRVQCEPSTAQSSLADKADRILGGDLLSSVTQAALLPDLLQRFWPWPVYGWDRAVALEHSFERVWWQDLRRENLPEEQTRDPTNPLFRYAGFFWDSYFFHWDPRSSNPALVLNTTEVETGNRVVISPFRVSGETPHQLLSIDDFKAHVNLPMSTAIGLSARFPFITPAGWYEVDSTVPGPRKRRLVDGAYFENSGVATAMDLYWALNGFVLQGAPIKIIVIALSGPLGTSAPNYAFSELLSPMQTLLNSRQTRGDESTETARLLLNQGRYGFSEDFREIILDVGARPLPLGWLLSKESRAKIRRAVGEAECDDKRRAVLEAPRAKAFSAAPSMETTTRHQAYADCVMWQIRHELAQPTGGREMTNTSH